MNTNITQLERKITDSWGLVEKAAQSRDRVATQSALDTVSHLENLKQQLLALEESIAASVSDDRPTEVVRSNDSPTEALPSQRSQQQQPFSAYSGQGKRSPVRPKEIKFGTFRKSIHYSYEIPMTVANWLIEQGRAVPTFPNFVHPSNSGFSPSGITKPLTNGQYMEVGDHLERLLEKARKLLDACGYRGLRLEVLLVDGNVKTA